MPPRVVAIVAANVMNEIQYLTYFFYHLRESLHVHVRVPRLGTCARRRLPVDVRTTGIRT